MILVLHLSTWILLIGFTATVLLSHGADINARNSTGHTPLGVARHWKRKNMAAFLIEHGAE